jgi:hypothetical protein
MNRRERIIELAREIDTMRGKLHAMEAEMDSLLPKDEPSAPATKYVIDTSAFVPLTERVIGFLETNRGRKYGANGIAQGIELTSDKMTSLRSTLVRLVDEKRIERAEPGVYCARQEQHAAA